jgi:hypothetical protein
MRDNIYAEDFYLLGYKAMLTFNGLHEVVSQKLELFITTAVRTSNPSTIILVMRDYFQ